MKKRAGKYLIFTILVISIFLTACMPTAGEEKQLNGNDELHVAAASALRFVFEEIGEAFEAEHGSRVIFQFGSSGSLAQQISGGAPLDLFASANKFFIESLVESGDIVAETAATFAVGRIVLAVNMDSQLEIQALEDLVSDQVHYISIANPSHAPYGQAAREALENKGLWSSLEDKLVYGETVFQAMQFVQTGNAPAGIIALSTADAPGIEYFPVDENLHNPLLQIMGVVSQSRKQELAGEFAAFVNGPVGQEILKKHGFSIPGEGAVAP